MRAVVQRVSCAEVLSGGRSLGKIGVGLMVLLGIGADDTMADVEYIAEKLVGLRIFEDEQQKMNLTVQDVGGSILLVSQFTLMGDARKGRRPGFSAAARPEAAVGLYEAAIERLEPRVPVATGEFGADMQLSLTNDGPVTILLDSKKLF